MPDMSVADLVEEHRFSEAIAKINADMQSIPEDISIRGKVIENGEYDLSTSTTEFGFGNEQVRDVVSIYDGLAAKLGLVTFSLSERLSNARFDAPARYTFHSLVALLKYAQNPVAHQPDKSSSAYNQVQAGLQKLEQSAKPDVVFDFEKCRAQLLSVDHLGFGYEHIVRTQTLRDKALRDVGIMKVGHLGWTDLTVLPASSQYYKSEFGRFTGYTLFFLRASSDVHKFPTFEELFGLSRRHEAASSKSPAE